MTGKQIKLLRYFAGQMTQEELASKTGITQSSLSRYEADILKVPPVLEQTIRKLFVDSGLDERRQVVLLEIISSYKGKGG